MPSIFVVISEAENKKITKNLEETRKSPIFAKANDYLICGYVKESCFDKGAKEEVHWQGGVVRKLRC